MISFGTIVKVNKNINELERMNVPLIFDIARILRHDLVVTEKIIDECRPGINAIDDEFMEIDEYGVRNVRSGLESEYKERMSKYEEEKTYDEFKIDFKYIDGRDFKVKEDYKTMRFDIRTFGLLEPIIR